MSNVSKEKHDELCVAYASMILFDGEAEITADAINSVISASNNEVEPYWPMMFANVLSQEGKILELISSGGPGAASGGAAAAAGDAGAEDAGEAKEEEAKEEEADLDLGGGMDMFGGEDY